MALSFQDFWQKFGETHYRCPSTKKVLYVAAPGADQTFVVQDDDGMSTNIRYSDKWYRDTDLSPPATGNFNYNGYMLRMYRRPTRQWRVGVCRQNHTVYNPMHHILGKFEPIYKPLWNTALIQAAYDRGYPTNVEDAIQRFDNDKCKSFALTANLGLSRSPTTEEGLLVWYRHLPVGWLHRIGWEIEDRRYEQEVRDEVRRWLTKN